MTIDPATVDPGTTRPVLAEAEATDRPDMDRARAVADAVLWEGYLLYPYRATSAKNRIRWQFGVLGPPGAAGRAGVAIAEDPAMHVECLLCAEAGAVVQVGLRFLHLVRRQVRAVGPGGDRAVEELRVGGRVQV